MRRTSSTLLPSGIKRFFSMSQPSAHQPLGKVTTRQKGFPYLQEQQLQVISMGLGMEWMHKHRQEDLTRVVADAVLTVGHPSSLPFNRKGHRMKTTLAFSNRGHQCIPTIRDALRVKFRSQ